MLAAENGAVAGGKVGGIGDVIRDAPRALADLQHRVTVLTPGYGHFSRVPGAAHISSVQTRFRGQQENLSLHRVPAQKETAGVTCLALEHPLFSCGGAGRIYIDDAPDRPFATDANRFALFCAASVAAIADGAIARPDIIHLHDWHSAVVALLIATDPAYAELRDIPLIFTIHNLALQGIRPLLGDHSSLCAWFPNLAAVPSAAIDPRYDDCFNPMRAAIVLCDRIHAVSPHYAEEICREDGRFGCGLQDDLRRAQSDGRLHGILNGCDYPAEGTPGADYRGTLALARAALRGWMGGTLRAHSTHVLALDHVDRLLLADTPRPGALLTSVGRLTEQKLGLLCTPMPDGKLCLEHLLDALGEDGLCVMLGSGDTELEAALTRIASVRSNLLFLCGYSDALAEALYAAGDLFLMPSTFEPCGISQMLAMRAGQPCLVNRVGGLVDTVKDGVTGFVFSAEDASAPEEALLTRLQQAMDCLRRQPARYRKMRAAAAKQRFEWGRAARAYSEQLYQMGLKAPRRSAQSRSARRELAKK